MILHSSLDTQEMYDDFATTYDNLAPRMGSTTFAEIQRLAIRAATQELTRRLQ